MAQTCPRCGLLNPPKAGRCDCGYDFTVLLALDYGVGTTSKEGEMGLFSGLGWFLLAGVIPLVNVWVLVELCALRGTVGGNQYGVDPLASP